MRFIRAGLFHGDEMTGVVNGSVWNALTRKGWVRTRVWSRPAHDPVAGDNSAVKVAAAVEAVLFVTDSPWTAHWLLKNRVTADYFEPQGRPLDPGGSPIAWKSGRLQVENGKWLVYVAADGHRQTLYEWQEGLRFDQHASLLWAGDLDGDGKTDLVVDCSEHANVTHIRMLLSSRRSVGQLLGQAAELRTTGC